MKSLRVSKNLTIQSSSLSMAYCWNVCWISFRRCLAWVTTGDLRVLFTFDIVRDAADNDRCEFGWFTFMLLISCCGKKRCRPTSFLYSQRKFGGTQKKSCYVNTSHVLDAIITVSRFSNFWAVNWVKIIWLRFRNNNRNKDSLQQLKVRLFLQTFRVHVFVKPPAKQRDKVQTARSVGSKLHSNEAILAFWPATRRRNEWLTWSPNSRAAVPSHHWPCWHDTACSHCGPVAARSGEKEVDSDQGNFPWHRFSLYARKWLLYT